MKVGKALPALLFYMSGVATLMILDGDLLSLPKRTREKNII